MSDEAPQTPVDSAASPATSTASDAAPSVAPAESATPSNETAPVTNTPAAEKVPEVEKVAETAPVAEPKKAETALGADPKAETPKDKAPEAKPEDTKSAEAAATEEPKKEEASQSDEPAPLPSYEAFTLPENITLDSEKLVEFTKDLGEFQNATKADQKAVQEFGQKLVDRHVAEVQETLKRRDEYYVATWEKQKSDWKEAFENDPEIGGNRKETTVNAALEFIRTHGGNEEQQKEFRDLMESTGLGNHPAIIRMLANANLAKAEGKPLPAAKPAPQNTSKVARRYGNT